MWMNENANAHTIFASKRKSSRRWKQKVYQKSIASLFSLIYAFITSISYLPSISFTTQLTTSSSLFPHIIANMFIHSLIRMHPTSSTTSNTLYSSRSYIFIASNYFGVYFYSISVIFAFRISDLDSIKSLGDLSHCLFCFRSAFVEWRKYFVIVNWSVSHLFNIIFGFDFVSLIDGGASTAKARALSSLTTAIKSSIDSVTISNGSFAPHKHKHQHRLLFSSSHSIFSASLPHSLAFYLDFLIYSCQYLTCECVSLVSFN